MHRPHVSLRFYRAAVEASRERVREAPGVMAAATDTGGASPLSPAADPDHFQGCMGAGKGGDDG